MVPRLRARATPGTAGGTTIRRPPSRTRTLVEENGRRGKHDPEFELLDTGAFDDDRYWVVEVDYVKADVDDIVMVVRATNAGPDAATLHVLPTAWFRNTWSWEIDAVKPTLGRRGDGVVAIDHPVVGPMELIALPGPDGRRPDALFCDNETNDRRVFGSASGTAYPKDGINDHVVDGAATVNPDHTGTQGVALVPARRGGRARPPRSGSGYGRPAPLTSTSMR